MSSKISLHKNNSRGASLVEMTLLVGLISLVALTAVQSAGSRIDCTFLNTASFVGSTFEFATKDRALECCPENIGCFDDLSCFCFTEG